MTGINHSTLQFYIQFTAPPIQGVVLIYSSSAHYELCLFLLAPSITPLRPLC
jgi:hypothetical protein